MQFAIAGTLLLLSGGSASTIPTQADAFISLKQITLLLSPKESAQQQRARVATFRAETQRVRSCAQLDALAKQMRDAGVHGNLTYRPEVRVSALPAAVRQLLKAAGPDRATLPFGKAPEVRVLVQCGPARQAPSRAPATT